jgi:methylenetetrahydrofolate reductase (NADPH)
MRRGAVLKTFRNAVREKDFAIAAQIYLRPETDAAAIRIQGDVLKDAVDAILLTDNQYGQLHMSTIAAASILLGHGVDPIVQLSSRNRNRIALMSDLLGAAAIGVSSLLLVAGERAPDSFQPKPKPVMDLTATELIRTATLMKFDEKLVRNPDFFVGGFATPVMPKSNWGAKNLREKIAAGAQFIQTHLCMDVELLRRYLGYLVANKLIERTSVIGAVAVLGSADDALWMRKNRPDAMVPDSVLKRLEAAADPREEGIRICAETIKTMRGIPGIAGVNIMAARDLSAIPAVIDAAGLDG